MNYFAHYLDYLALAFGFGFVIFFHELGHFLAAKYCDVKVEQFAVGFGPAIVSWRKGLGARWGSSGKEFDDMRRSAADGGKDQSAGVSDTEYRLNWIPLGGYVKMLGQDDLRPNAIADDPRSYNNKSIGQRMIIVSAGVVMNVILAAILFMIVFRLGYPMPPAIVGGTLSRSPAMDAVRVDGSHVALQPGDKILKFDGKDTTGDFTKIALDVALSSDGETVPIEVQHLDGTVETLQVTPQHSQGDPRGLLQLGIAMPTELAGFDPAQIDDWDEANLKQTEPADFLAVKPGDVITQINGQDVAVDEFWKLNQALAQSDGKPVDLTVAADGGKGAVSHEMVWPHMQDSFVKDDLDFLGMIPRAVIAAIPEKKSPAVGKLFPGDVIEDLESAGDGLADPTRSQVRETLAQAGDKQLAVSLTVLGEDGKERTAENITPNVNLGGGKVGLGIGLQNDEQHLVVADVMKGSSADGKIPVRATITAANDKPITNWFELRTIIAGCAAGDSLKVTYLAHGDETPKVAEIPLTAADIQSARTIAFASDLMLREMPGQKKTTNPVTALKLGVVETRDLIAQFYLTLRRMFTGELSYKNAMGPVGMFTTGKQIATKGANWLLWYLAMISANLAVVNFLPIPIVDGGLFTLLILEKIQGKPLSPEIQRIVQAVGLALILGVFLLVTWQDIARAAGYVN